MKYFFSTLLFFIGFLLFNLFLFSWEYFLLLISLIFLVLYLYMLYKYKKLSLIFIPISLVLFYSLFFWYINIDKQEKYTFLNDLDDKNMSYSWTIQSNLRKCLKKEECDIDNALKDDLKSIEKLVNNPSWFSSTFILNYLLNSIKENKEKITNKEIIYSFDKEKYNKNVIKSMYILSKDFDDSTDYNLFFSRKQYRSYLRSYYYHVYDLIENNKIYEIKNNTYKNNNNFLIFLNRKYLYNSFIEDESIIIRYVEILNEIEKTLSEIRQ